MTAGMIQQVTPLEDYRLLVALQNGSVLELCMESLLQTIRFCPLADKALFDSVRTDGFSLFFGTVMTIGLEEVLALAALAPPSPIKKREEEESREKIL